MTVIKKSIGNAFMTIPSTYMQQWSSPKFNMGSVSRQGVAVGRNERTITDEVVRICAFLRDVQFATADQIVKGTGVNFDKAQNNLMSQHFVNSFVLTDIQDPSELRVQDALRIYTLDFAGVYLLSIEGYDMTTWRWTDYLVSATVVRKALVQTEIYVEMSKSTVCEVGPGPFTPKSFKSIVVLALKPARSPPHGSLPSPLKVALKVTGLVTPWNVRSPVTSAVFSPVDLTAVDTNLASANLATSMKSLLAMCLSRSAWLDHRLAVFTSTAILLASGLAASQLKVPSQSLKVPWM